MRKMLFVSLSMLVVFFMTGVSVMAEEASSEILEGAVSMPVVTYQTHIQNIGWEVEDAGQALKQNGKMSGTSGKGLRLEGIKIKIENNTNLGIQYQTHIQNIGWENDTGNGWKKDGEMSGTKGRGYRLEAIQMRLTGEEAGNYDLYYQVHAQNMGWLGWAKNGESAGTAGFGYRLEGIRIVIVPVGTAVPNETIDKEEPFYENLLAPYFSIKPDIEKLGWSNGKSRTQQLYYVFKDISNDGIAELIIGFPATPPNFSMFPYYGKADHEVAVIYQIRNGLPIRVIGRDATIRGRYYLEANNHIIDFGTGGAQYHGWSYFSLNGYKLNFIESVHLDNSNGEKYTLRDQNEKLLKTLSKTEAYKIFDKYTIQNNIDWQPLNF